MSEIIGNRYQITKLIGKGGMAEVYLAWDPILNRDVAIKILKSDMADDDVALKRFKREAGATTQLSHPNIVDVYDVGDDNDKHYIVMEYVKGYTLKQLIKKRGPLSCKEAVWIIKQLAGALMEAHRKGIIHRDVKSQNVLIKDDGTIKLSDFGIALASDAMQITSKDSVLGSVHYLAPELSRGKQASMQSDIYSLGIVFYELLTGDVPFKAETPVQVALMHVRNNIPSVRISNSTIPQSVDNIIIKATAKSLSNRYKNIALMIKDLNECLKPDNRDVPRIVFDDNTKLNSNIDIKADSNDKKPSKFPKLLIVLISLISVVAIVAILFLSGVIGPESKLTVVPDIVGLTVIEAKDTLSEYNLLIDDSLTEYELSDHMAKDGIISISPDVGSEVNINTKLKVVVSSGVYSVLGDYINKNYLDAKADLEYRHFNVKLIPVLDDNKKTGTVIEQSLPVGYKYDESTNNQIELTYTISSSIIIDPSIEGASLDDAAEFFVDNNIKYHFEKLDNEKLSDEEKDSYKEDIVIRTEPEIGSSISINDDIDVIVYYYEED